MNLITRTTRPAAILMRSLIARFVLTVLGFSLVSQAMASLDEVVVQKIKHSTVRVAVIVDDQIVGHGSGFIISKDGHVATNRHVIENAQKLLVIFCDEQDQKILLEPAEFVCSSQTADLAILQIKPIPGTEVATLSTAEPLAGQAVSSVGFPGVIDKRNLYEDECIVIEPNRKVGKITKKETADNFVPAIFEGTVAKMMTENGTRIILHGAKISPGNSGGPLIDIEGRVCGINTKFAPANHAGADYPIAIHASVLAGLAAERSIQILVDRSLVSAEGRSNPFIVLLLLLVGALAVVSFIMVLRKPRTVIVDSFTKFVRHVRPSPPVPNPKPGPAGRSMRLRGRSPDGRTFIVEMRPNQFSASNGRLVIGRNPDLCGLVVSHDSVSRQHASLTLIDNALWIEDRNSGNGTSLNGIPLTLAKAPMPVRPGDKLTLGEVEFILE